MAGGELPSWDCVARKRALVFCLATVPLLAQSSASSGRLDGKDPAAGPPTFKSATNLVEATAVVRDRQSKAVGDLKADDFQLFDSGKRQVISRFAVEALESHEPKFSRERNIPAGSRGGANALPNHFVAFVVDDQNIVPEHFPLATMAAIRHVLNLRPGDRAAVRSTSGRMILGFTGDREKLREALSGMGSMGRRTTFDVSALNPEITCKITYLKADWILDGDSASLRNCAPKSSMPAPLPPVVRGPSAGVPLGVPGEAHQIVNENQVRAFAESIVQAGDRDVLSYFAGLGELIGAMSHMPGERSIILLSPGMYIAPRFRSLQDQLIAEAVRARVVISGVDPRGVYIRNDPDDPATWSDTWGLAETRERVSFMENVSFGTGGSFIRGNNDIEGAIRRLDTTPEFVYILGFSPSPLKLDGQYHPLKVVLNRPHGLAVDARRGYYAADQEQDSATQVQRQIERAFFSDQELHDLPVKLQLRSSHKPNSNIILTAIAEIDLRKVPFRKEDTVNRSGLLLMVGLFDQDGNFVKDFWKDITLHPDDEKLDALRQSGIEVQTNFDVTPGRYLVRLLVRDGEGQAVGTQTMGVDIRP